MRSERLGLTLASAVILGLILLSFSLSPAAAEVYPDTENIILRGSSTAYGHQGDGVPPMIDYEEGSSPPIMAGTRMGSGTVVAAAFAGACADGEWNNPENPSPNLDIFMGKLFQWMNPGAVKVLWYEGHDIYNNIARCGELASALGDLDYDVVPKTTEPLTESFLEEYDIVILPQLQEGEAETGGDPSAIENDEVDALKGYVEGGGGLLIMDQSDFLGYNFYKVPNKVLEGFDFSPNGTDLRFQSDSIYDDSSNWNGDEYRPVVNVNTDHPVGVAYQESTGKSTLGIYKVASLAVPGIVVNVIPAYEVAEPGEELVYPVEVSNSYTEDLTIELSSEDNAGWNMSFDDTSLSIPVGESKFTDLRVTIPDSAEMGGKDEITVTATSSEYADVTDSASVTGGVAIRIEASQSVYVDNESPELNFDGGALRIGRFGSNWQQSYLMFDNLEKIPSDANITDVKLHLFCFSAYGSAQEMETVSVPGNAGDAWLEEYMTWNSKPEAGSVLDTQLIGAGSESNPTPYSWNVTSFIEQERAGDGTASLLVRPVETCPPSTNREFEQDNWFDWQLRPFLEVKTGEGPEPSENQAGVLIEVSDGEKEGSPGDQIEFTFNVTNTGDSSDTISLSASPENSSWASSVSPSTLTLDSGGSGSVTLSVDIPSAAEDDASSDVTVTATSQAGSSVSDSADCTAVAKAGAGPGEGDGEDGGIPLVYAGIIIVVVVVVAAAMFVTRGE